MALKDNKIWQDAVKIFRILIPLACSALLIIWLFKKVDFKNVWSIIHGDTNFVWLLLVMVVVVLSHIIRGIRWGIQLRAAGLTDIPKMTLCCSIFGAYSINLLVPYLGEAWRIIFIARRKKAPVSTVLGTDIGDRISDAMVVLSLLVVALIVGHKYIFSFIDHYAVGAKIIHILSEWWLWASIVATIGIIAFCLYYFRNNKTIAGINRSLSRVWQGFKVLFTMKGKWTYFWLTLGIWSCYYLETYITFLAFPFTRALMEQDGMAWGLLPALISFVFSSMSMLIPSNGGLGPWNLAVMFALSLFGISTTEGTAFSMVLWTTTTITLVLLGLYTIGYVILTRHRLKTPDHTT